MFLFVLALLLLAPSESQAGCVFDGFVGYDSSVTTLESFMDHTYQLYHLPALGFHAVGPPTEEVHSCPISYSGPGWVTFTLPSGICNGFCTAVPDIWAEENPSTASRTGTISYGGGYSVILTQGGNPTGVPPPSANPPVSPVGPSGSVTLPCAPPQLLPLYGLKAGDSVDIVVVLRSATPNANGSNQRLFNIRQDVDSTTVGQFNLPFYEGHTPLHFDVLGNGNALFYAGFIGTCTDQTATLEFAVNRTRVHPQHLKNAAAQMAHDAAEWGESISAVLDAAEVGMLTPACATLILLPRLELLCVAITRLGWIAQGFSFLMDHIAGDPPDSNYTDVAVPSVPVLPPLVGSPLPPPLADAYSALSWNMQTATGYSRAIGVSLDRAAGAEAAGNTRWNAVQRQAAAIYTRQLGAITAGQPALLNAFSTELMSAGVPNLGVNYYDFLEFENDVLRVGLPASAPQTLAPLGLALDEVSGVRRVVIVQRIQSVSFPQSLTSGQFLQSIQQNSAINAAALVPIPGSVIGTIDLGNAGLAPGAATAKAASPGSAELVLFGTTLFDVDSIDPGSIRIGLAGAIPVPGSMQILDLDGDGVQDLRFAAEILTLGVSCGKPEVRIAGVTYDGVPIGAVLEANLTGCGGYYSVTPCRAVDTREPAGPVGGPPILAGVPRSFVIVGLCGVPVTASSIAVNATVTEGSSGGHLTFFPGEMSVPLTSTLNYSAGQTRANNAIIPLGASGDISVVTGQPTGAVHLIIDITGYFQ